MGHDKALARVTTAVLKADTELSRSDDTRSSCSIAPQVLPGYQLFLQRLRQARLDAGLSQVEAAWCRSIGKVLVVSQVYYYHE